MAVLKLTKEQVIGLVKQLPPDQQRAALLALAEGTAQRREERMAFAEAQIRRLTAARGLDWEKSSDDAREAFIDDFLHDDRPCGK